MELRTTKLLLEEDLAVVFNLEFHLTEDDKIEL
jgi:hypothetical protein